MEAGPSDYSVGEIAKASAGNDISEDESDLKEVLATMTRDVRDQIVEHEQQIIATVRALGGSTSRYRFERRSQVRAIVSEIDSPRHVTAVAKLQPELNVICGFALDLTISDSDGRPWEFDEKEMRDRALTHDTGQDT